jgi:hypothetical protein
MRHVERVADEAGSAQAIYVVVPRGIKSFLDIYKAILEALIDKHILTGVGQALLKAHGTDVSTDSERALVRLAIGSPEEQRIAAAWLHGDRLTIRDVKMLGVTRRIETVNDAVHTLNDVLQAIHRQSPVILLIDEVQELEELQKRLPECVGGLHKIFDLNPRGLTIVFSFTTGSRTTARSILGPALYDRAADVVALPPLSAPEALEFIEGVIRVWSIDETLAPAPFAPDALKAVVSELDDGTGVTPRTLMKAFGRILRDGEFDIAAGERSHIDADYALEILGTISQDDLS